MTLPKPLLPPEIPATPFYFYDERTLNILSKAFKDSIDSNANILLHYAMKSNSNPELLRKLRAFGSGIDTVSGEELKVALECGYEGDLIVFSGVGKSEAELQLAIDSQIGMIIVESKEEYEELCVLAARSDKKVKVGFRFNPNLSVETHPYIATGLWEHKFGIATEEIIKLLSHKQPTNIIFEGLSLHLGSQIFDYKIFYDAVDEVVKLAKRIRDEHKISFPVLNVGGGLGVDYTRPYQIPDFENYGKFLKDSLKKWQLLNPDLKCKVYSECGRALVAQSGYLVTRVIRIKSNPKKNFAIVDASMTELIRPALYEAYHEIEKLNLTQEEMLLYDVVGAVCESGDFLGQARKLEKLKKGDLLWVSCAGAYGYVMSNHYNMRPLPAEYFLTDEKKLRLSRAPIKTWLKKE